MKNKIAEKLIAPSFVLATIAFCFGIATRREKLDSAGSIVSDWNSQEYWMYISFLILTVIFVALCGYCIYVTAKER